MSKFTKYNNPAKKRIYNHKKQHSREYIEYMENQMYSFMLQQEKTRGRFDKCRKAGYYTSK